MNMQKGKITIMSVIVFCILVLAAIMAFKYLANGIEKKEIKIEIHDTIGVLRGSQLNDVKVKEIIAEVLNKRSLKPLEAFCEFTNKGKINFSYKYEVTINYILFKHNEIIAVEDEMDSYGG